MREQCEGFLYDGLSFTKCPHILASMFWRQKTPYFDNNYLQCVYFFPFTFILICCCRSHIYRDTYVPISIFHINFYIAQTKVFCTSTIRSRYIYFSLYMHVLLLLLGSIYSMQFLMVFWVHYELKHRLYANISMQV